MLKHPAGALPTTVWTGRQVAAVVRGYRMASTIWLSNARTSWLLEEDT
jgi:hypothetical protein